MAWLSALSLVGVLSSGPALAEPSAADKETARHLMKEGDEKFAAHDYPGAMKAYQAAHAIMQVPSTGLALARAQIERGLLVEARDTLLQVMRTSREAGEPAAYGKAREEAGPLAMKISDRIPSLTISVEGPPSGTQLDVSIDNVAIPAAALGAARKVNPGAHAIVAAASGFKTTRKNLVLKESDNEKVVLKLAPGADAPEEKGSDLKGGGKIHVTSPKEPGNVIIDGKAVGATPLDVPVTRGTHKIEVEYPGGSRDVRRVNVTTGATVQVETSPSPMDAVASHRKGVHLGFSVGPEMELFLGGGAPVYGGTGAFVLNIGITPTVDFRTGAIGGLMYRPPGGPHTLQIHALIPASLKINWTSWFSSSAGLTLGFSSVILLDTKAPNQYGFVIGPEWSPFTLSAGDKRQYELGFTQGMRFGTVNSDFWEYHQGVSFTYLWLD
jgi:hypothetical protein